MMFLSSSLLDAQNEDYIWMFGHDSNLFIEGQETYYFDFNKGSSPDSLRGLSPLWISGNNASICDAEGHLLFYTNGCHVADRNHNIMPNGSGINEGGNFLEFFRRDTCSNYPGRQDVLILNDPGNEEGYYLLHKRTEFELGELFLDKLLYSYIDMNMNSRNGDVTEKNVSIIDTIQILAGYLTAIRHTNQEDWWILQPDERGNFLIFTLDRFGLNLESIQQSDIQFHSNASAAGTAKFSPDGTKYVYFNTDDNVLLYDFDRSTGLLSNMRELDVRPGGALAVFTSVEFSPSSRFLYLAATDELYQIDTWEDNLENGLVLIDTWNGVQDPFNTTFVLMASAPDCKIYMCSGSSTNTYHVINKPNEKGVACDFVQQGIRLPFVSATATMPNFPRFRVDEEDKCDETITSIFGDRVFYRRDMTVYPNPVRDLLNIEIPEGHHGRLVVFDMMGQLVWSGDSDRYSGEVQIDLSQLAVGTYSVEFLPADNRERLVFTAQVVRVE
jgi:WD40 repeat protein